MRTAAEATMTLAESPKRLGARIGLLAVLHTCGQTLTHHLHVHCVVPGGGVSLDGERWITCKPSFFLPVKALARLFRRLFLTALEAAFDFLGFTHSWGKSRKGKDVVRQITAKSRFSRSLAAVKDWCRTNRHRPAREQRAWLSAVLNGHYAYYGITGNYRRLQEYRYRVVKIWRKWLERRTRGWLLTWDSFKT